MQQVLKERSGAAADLPLSELWIVTGADLPQGRKREVYYFFPKNNDFVAQIAKFWCKVTIFSKSTDRFSVSTDQHFSICGNLLCYLWTFIPENLLSSAICCQMQHTWNCLNCPHSISAIYSINTAHALIVNFPPVHTTNTPFYCCPWLDGAESLMLSALPMQPTNTQARRINDALCLKIADK